MHSSMREGISRQSNNRFSILMLVGLCLGIFSAFMTNTKVAAQLTQGEQEILNQSQTLINETNEIFKELVGNLTAFSFVQVQIALASLQSSTDPLIKQQMLDKAQTLANQIIELNLELDEHLATLKKISDLFDELLRQIGTTVQPSTLTTVAPTVPPIKMTQPAPNPLGNCATNLCGCSCAGPTSDANGHPVGGIPLNGNFQRSSIGQCWCLEQSNYFSTVYISASQTSNVSEIIANPPIQSSPTDCPNLCLRSLDGTYYKASGYRQILLAYYCGPNNDPQDCALYAIFIPSDFNQGVTITSLNDANGTQGRKCRDSTQPLGKASDYLQISGASCGGCCLLSPAFDKPACSPQGTFYPSLSVDTKTTNQPIKMTKPPIKVITSPESSAPEVQTTIMSKPTITGQSYTSSVMTITPKKNCTTTRDCYCTCDAPTYVTKGQPAGAILLVHNYYQFRSSGALGQCACAQDSIGDLATVYISASQTSNVSDIIANPPIQSVNCLSICLHSQDGTFYTGNGLREVIIAYYCGPNNDPQACAFYAILIPFGFNPDMITLSADDGIHTLQNGDNTMPLGDSYLKIVGASCGGCCDMRALFANPTCSPQGTFTQSYKSYWS